MNFPQQNHKISSAKLAEKYNKSQRNIMRDLKTLGLTKTREQYEQDAKLRREIAYNLRQNGLKFREIAELLGITINNAQQLVRRYQQ